MSKTSADLLIIYESEAEQWASYLRSLLADSIPEAGICCYDIAMVTGRRDTFLELSGYKCKLLILSRGMLEGLCQLRRFFLARVLRPEARVVVLLCGVDSLMPLLELVPLKGEQCLQISSEQDAQEYRSAVAEIVRRGEQTSDMRPAQELKPERKLPAGASQAKSPLLLLPSRVPCENPGEVFLLLQEPVVSKDCEVEFSGGKQRARVKPMNWNENTLSVVAAEFPAGSVGVTLYCRGVIKAKARLHYYSTMGEIERLLKQAADPMNFMCQAFQVSSTEKLDHILGSCLMRKMPTGGFQGLQNDQTVSGSSHSEDIPTLLHFAAEHGLKDLASILLQCPGAQQAMRTTNCLGYTPLVLAHTYGHTQLHVLLQESLAMSSGEDCNDDTSVYELMGSAGNLQVTDSHDEARTGGFRDADEEDAEDEEDPYAHLGASNEEYDTILTSSSSVVIANRPPAPTPRPETLPPKEDSTPFIAQVFQKKMSQADSETLYSLPTKQARGRHTIPSTYDTFVPSQDELIRLQEQVKRGSLSMDEALERFSDWQRLQRGLDSLQQEKLQQLRASIINNREDDDSVYDKINIVHHTPPVTTNECRSGSQQAETDFYSKPLKGQHSNFFWKADKR
ncbi:B-cell scaffold protein with ankyrin repeats [Pygocentrus nattereri]|uniref:B-cell scaffold protein with ankyrin repeats n=1 Tax=Pygocentrus nattereri TaxID=42514 RepID=UPI0008145B85|nr:B-cell scaffold protein with ankyrin repeats [Pygocentrus nattereri]